MREADLWRPSPGSDVITSSLVAVPADPAPFPVSESPFTIITLSLSRCQEHQLLPTFRKRAKEGG